MEENDDLTLGRRVKRYREAAGMTQAELAQALSDAGIPGMHPQTMVKIEAGTRSLKFSEGIEIARLLGIRAEQLQPSAVLAEEAVKFNKALDEWFRATNVLAEAVRGVVRSGNELRARIYHLEREEDPTAMPAHMDTKTASEQLDEFDLIEFVSEVKTDAESAEAAGDWHAQIQSEIERGK